MNILRVTTFFLIVHESLAYTHAGAVESDNRNLGGKGKDKDDAPCFVCPEDKKTAKELVKNKCEIREQCPQSCVVEECEYLCHDKKEIWVEECPNKGGKDDKAEDEKFENDENNNSDENIRDSGREEGDKENGAPQVEVVNEGDGVNTNVNSDTDVGNGGGNDGNVDGSGNDGNVDGSGNDGNGVSEINDRNGTETGISNVDSGAIRCHTWASAFVAGATCVYLI